MKILIGGDFSPRNRMTQIIESGNGSEIFSAEVVQLFSDSDLNIINFETTIAQDGQKPINKIGPRLKTTEKSVDVLKNLGVDVVTLANNHAFDYGKDALINTLNIFNKNDIEFVGAGLNINEASKILYKKIDNSIIAIINCCEHEYGIATKDTAGTNPLNPVSQYYAITEARKQADYIIVIVHGGSEQFQLPSLRMQDTYRYFIDLGADVVVNHHQHCYSGYEIYKDRPIYYGLGNFAFDISSRPRPFGWCEGILLSLEFIDNQIKHKPIPYIQFRENPNVALMIDRTEFNIKFESLSKTIVDREKLEEELDAFYKSHERRIYSLLQPWPDRYFRGAFFHGYLPSLVSRQSLAWIQNYVECQSHYEKLVYFLDKNARSTR